MTLMTAFAVSLGLVLALALVVILVLRRSLSDLLTELCGNNRRARFWTVFTALGIVLGSLECALLTLPRATSQAWSDLPGMHLMLSGVRAGVFGLLATCCMLGVVLLIGIARHEIAETR